MLIASSHVGEWDWSHLVIFLVAFAVVALVVGLGFRSRTRRRAAWRVAAQRLGLTSVGPDEVAGTLRGWSVRARIEQRLAGERPGLYLDVTIEGLRPEGPSRTAGPWQRAGGIWHFRGRELSAAELSLRLEEGARLADEGDRG